MNWKKFVVSESQKREKEKDISQIPDFTTRHYFVDVLKE